jgi:hypothetical protein
LEPWGSRGLGLLFGMRFSNTCPARRISPTPLDGRRNLVPLLLEGFDNGTPKIASRLMGRLGGKRAYLKLASGLRR